VEICLRQRNGINLLSFAWPAQHRCAPSQVGSVVEFRAAEQFGTRVVVVLGSFRGVRFASKRPWSSVATGP